MSYESSAAPTSTPVPVSNLLLSTQPENSSNPNQSDNPNMIHTAPASSIAHRNTSSSSRFQGTNSVVLRIQQELNSFTREPVPFLYIDVDEADVTKVAAIIIGPLDTPYAGGIFRFDLTFGSSYPMRPPTVSFATTSGGRVRFNPNLYANGHVCLSILGTWSGPAWSSAESLTSILLSIQSIMCPQPYHNEPGYEKRGDEPTKQAYNDYIKYETLSVGVLESINSIWHSDKFPGICDRLFLMWFDTYISIANDLKQRREGQTIKDAFSGRAAFFCMDPIILKLHETKAKILSKMNHINEIPVDSDSDDDSEDSNANEESRSESHAMYRLLDEADCISRNPPLGSSASPRDRSSPFIWDATLFGPENTCWEGGLFTLEMRFSFKHPDEAPFIKFTSKVFHPNITTDGVPALDMIHTRWQSSTKISTVLEELQKLLATPNTVYPVNLEASKLFQSSKAEYESKVRRLAQDSC